MDYMSFVEQLNIKQGDKIMLSSELIKLVLLYKKSGIKFDGSILLDTFQEAVGVDGTILIPTFSFDFNNKGIYDVVNTKGTTGVLGNIALQRGDFVRTQHPMHSFAVWGKDKDLFAMFHIVFLKVLQASILMRKVKSRNGYMIMQLVS